MIHAPSRAATPRRPFLAKRAAAAVAVLAAAVTGLTACGSSGGSGKALALSAALPDKVPSGTTLRVGDPEVQAALSASGLQKQLDAEGVHIQYANISGGPDSIAAFRGNKLDCASVADIPSLFAAWTGTKTEIVFQAVTINPLQYPVYKLGVAPGVSVKSLADLKGKKIAYSAGQAQGALVLRVLQKAGLTQKDVDLVPMTSSPADQNYVTPLGGKAVDVAPLGTSSSVAEYLEKYPSGSVISTGIRDDASTFYCLTSSVKDAGKAAALADYVAARAKAELWENTHGAEMEKVYWEKVEGLNAADAAKAQELQGQNGIPANWDAATTRLQQTADLLSQEQNHPKLDVKTLEDFRFEKIEAKAAGSAAVTGAAS